MANQISYNLPKERACIKRKMERKAILSLLAFMNEAAI
jgi:hypothetical protein